MGFANTFAYDNGFWRLSFTVPVRVIFWEKMIAETPKSSKKNSFFIMKIVLNTYFFNSQKHFF
ncbi:MAG: hypothetical protein COZ16_07780 [Flavobacteriaceae bacterium CG_4_10_14_3_um_filter_31_253]|nr:MAG: hypothetical protein AUK46_04570 [Flavobacteriaceae bacterium CG2_30_31_66]PIV97468.1 MAG: hypothetical protein COW43_03540 [Flavobacteriaceae bacterium CG17_big_fil_post_rev_8_21_14_2_50_31_13]PIX14282.1 MAG: hypothetical protein COZ74_03405 [Flavobacteriaceae bacterium CG_4_8_14_3_um_filter_31_8]PIY14827.1 MAG: hypothetical protein COZ16_07780 [Flavobacteriaceae bacterium CG_4_10_14_3_um_filter_31_253]PIZ12175.1 MAG: hypothetical protein COY55_01800 [Flavobacteriaceae bacterium CG_4_1